MLGASVSEQDEVSGPRDVGRNYTNYEEMRRRALDVTFGRTR